VTFRAKVVPHRFELTGYSKYAVAQTRTPQAGFRLNNVDELRTMRGVLRRCGLPIATPDFDSHLGQLLTSDSNHAPSSCALHDVRAESALGLRQAIALRARCRGLA